MKKNIYITKYFVRKCILKKIRKFNWQNKTKVTKTKGWW